MQHIQRDRPRPATRRAATTLLLAAACWLAAPAASAGDTSPAAQASQWATQAGGADAARGERFFTTTHGKKWSCASCHKAPPVTTGKHAGTGKIIKPLAPAFNPEAFTETRRVEKWFRRNCNDVLGRECTPREKADVLAWLVSLRQ